MQPITDDDIHFAENILFGRINVFDDERKLFIREFQTCDLQAVPGSGKTTALLAKLLIIEKYLPLENGRSLLVISHTNAAVDEIRNKIGKHCPKLFSEPHFIGTIQSFTDKFLAIPYYTNYFKNKPFRIDDEIYSEKASQFNKHYDRAFTAQENTNAKYYLNSNDNAHSIRLSLIGDRVEISKEHQGAKLVINRPRSTAATNWNNNEKEQVYKWILKFKSNLLKVGYLCFDDGYFLAKLYLSNFPRIKNILQKNFALVFVDEMQDMDVKQYELLEEIFFNGGVSESIFQRIGDKNQSIFANEVALVDHWVDRPIKHEFIGSHRLTPLNSNVVEYLALSPIHVVGHRQLDNPVAREIKPHLLVYNDRNITNVIEQFTSIISQFQLQGVFPVIPEKPIKAICWNTKDEPGKIRISNFFPNYSKEEQRLKITYSSLESYLYLYDKDELSIATVRKSILNAILRILRLEEINDINGKPFNKHTLIKYLFENNPAACEELKLNIYNWSKGVLNNNEANVLASIKVYLPTLLTLFGKPQTNSTTFMNNRHVNAPPAGTLNVGSNFVTLNGVTVEVATVHSVKGQTHTATLYLESYYQRDIRGSGNYESERLSRDLLAQPRNPVLDNFTKQSLKMAYVGFSRPTHLLCFAVHEDRFNARLPTIDLNTWEVIRIP